MPYSFRAATAAAFALVLASCYQTSAPLISAATADWPLGDGITYIKDDESLGLMDVPGRIWRSGNAYLMQEDGSFAVSNQLLFHQIRDNFYAVQRDDSGLYYYDLVRVENDAVYAYGLQCHYAEDALFIAGGALTTTGEGTTFTCTPNSLDTLMNVLMAKSDTSPETIYTRTGAASGPAPVSAAQAAAQIPIAFGQTVSGQLTAAGQVQDGKYINAYRFNGTAGQNITIEMRDDTLDTYLMLYRADDPYNLLASDDDSAGNFDARITYTLPQSGDYLIYATSAYAGFSGAYNLTLNGTPVQGTPAPAGAAQQTAQPAFMSSGGNLTYGQTITSRLDDNLLTIDGKYHGNFYFQGNAGDDIEIRMNADGFDTYLFLQRPLTDDELLLPPSEFLEQTQGSMIEDDDGGEGLNSLIRTVLSVSGEYTITASSAGTNQTGDFELSLTRLGGQAPATGNAAQPGQVMSNDPRGQIPISYGGRITERLDDTTYTDDQDHYLDVYRFDGTVGDQIEIRMDSTDVDARIYLYDDLDSFALAEDDDGGEVGANSLIRYTLPQSGRYLIVASSFGAFDEGAYALSLVRTNAPAAGNAGGNVIDGIDFGGNSSNWANNNICDDPRFEGEGASIIMLDQDLRADAADCIALYRAGRINLR